MEAGIVDPGETLARELSRRLAVKGWTTDALARRATLGRTAVSKALNGKEVPSIRTVSLLAGALGCDPDPLLGLRAAAAKVAVPSSVEVAGTVVVDVGSVEDPNRFIGVAEVRFSVSNYLTTPVKLTSLALSVTGWTPVSETQAKVVGAPIDEYFLYAKVPVASVGTFELLDRHHMLHSDETDGFFLRIDGPEGYRLSLEIEAQWHVAGSAASQASTSLPFEITFPAYSAAGLLSLITRDLQRSGD